MVKYFKANRSVCYVDWCLACLCEQMEFGKVDGLPGSHVRGAALASRSLVAPYKESVTPGADGSV